MYTQFIIIFGLIIVGFYLGRRGVMTEEFDAGMNKIIMRLVIPCMLLDKIGNLQMDHRTIAEFFLTMGVFVVISLVIGGYAYLYARVRRFPKENSNVAECCMTLPNNGFMGFPLASTFFGEIGLLMMAATNTAMNIVTFSYGVALMERSGTDGKAPIAVKIKKLVRHMMNPMMAATVVSLVICGFHIPIPEAAAGLFAQISNLCTPLSMFYIGSTLSRGKMLAVLKNRVVIEASANKLIVAPLVTWALVYFLPLSSMAKAICVMSSSMPTAAICAMLAGEYRQDTEMAGMILLVTTALSAATMIGFVHLIRMFIL